MFAQLHLIIIFMANCCRVRVVGSTISRCLPFSHIMYTCMVLVILVFVGGNEVEGNYTYVVCWGLKDAVVKVHKLVIDSLFWGRMIHE